MEDPGEREDVVWMALAIIVVLAFVLLSSCEVRITVDSRPSPPNAATPTQSP